MDGAEPSVPGQGLEIAADVRGVEGPAEFRGEHQVVVVAPSCSCVASVAGLPFDLTLERVDAGVGECEGAAAGSGLHGPDHQGASVALEAGFDAQRWGSGLEVDAAPGEAGGFPGAQAQHERECDQALKAVPSCGDQERLSATAED